MRIGRSAALLALICLVAGCNSTSVQSSPGTGSPASTRPGSPTSQASVATASAADLQSGHWSTLPPAPIQPRTSASVVWSGRELLVWGGFSYSSHTVFSDGAAYDPKARGWRSLAASPLSPRTGQSTAWTGNEMVVWGGLDNWDVVRASGLDDGAAYNPTTDKWRLLPHGPLSPRGDAITTWTGLEMIVLGGTSGSGKEFSDGAGLDPTSGRWRGIAVPTPPGGHSLTWRAGAFIDGRLLAWSEWATSSQIGPNSYAMSGGADLFSYSPVADSWRTVPPSENALPDVFDVLVANTQVIVRGLPFNCGQCSHPFIPPVTAMYDPAGNEWSRLPADPLAVDSLSSAWTGAALFSFNTATMASNTPLGSAETYDPEGRSWFRLPGSPVVCPVEGLAWTGRDILAYCSWSPPSAGSTPLSGLVFEVP
jgi:hypothetical protein